MNESRVLFEDDMDDDPYGTAIELMRVVLNKALDRDGKMSDTEHQHLLEIDKALGPKG